MSKIMKKQLSSLLTIMLFVAAQIFVTPAIANAGTPLPAPVPLNNTPTIQPLGGPVTSITLRTYVDASGKAMARLQNNNGKLELIDLKTGEVEFSEDLANPGLKSLSNSGYYGVKKDTDGSDMYVNTANIALANGGSMRVPIGAFKFGANYKKVSVPFSKVADFLQFEKHTSDPNLVAIGDGVFRRTGHSYMSLKQNSDGSIALNETHFHASLDPATAGSKLPNGWWGVNHQMSFGNHYTLGRWAMETSNNPNALRAEVKHDEAAGTAEIDLITYTKTGQYSWSGSISGHLSLTGVQIIRNPYTREIQKITGVDANGNPVTVSADWSGVTIA